MGKRLDVLAVGLQTVDLLVSPVDPEVLERDLTLAKDVRMDLGGDALNQAVTLAKLGARTGLMGAVGRDALGGYLLGRLRTYPLALFEGETDAPTAVSVVLIDGARERHFVYRPGSNDRFSYRQVEEAAVRDAAIVSVAGAMGMASFDGADTLRLLELARRSGARTAMDFQPIGGRAVTDGLRAALRLTDDVLPSEKEAALLTGERDAPERMAEALLDMGARNCVIKLGGRGCYLRADGAEGYLPACPCRCADTTGAGDAFAAAFLWGRARGWDAETCARFANAAGSIAVEQVGANGAVRSQEQVLRRMNGAG